MSLAPDFEWQVSSISLVIWCSFAIVYSLRKLMRGACCMEDDFHRKKGNNKTLRAIYSADTAEAFKHLTDNLFSDRVERLLRSIIPADTTPWTMMDTVENKHPAICTEIDESNHRIIFHMNHSLMGGDIFLRYLESLSGQEPCTLPLSNPARGIAAIPLHMHRLLAMAMRMPDTCSPRTKENQHYEKTAIVPYTDVPQGVYKRFYAYYLMLEDMCVLFNKDRIVAGFTVVFESKKRVTPNNVGMVVIRHDRGTRPIDVQKQFKKRRGQALISNSLMLSGIGRLFVNDAGKFRQKLNLICSSIMVKSDVAHQVRVVPAREPFEGAYVAMYNRLDDTLEKMHITTSVTTTLRDIYPTNARMHMFNAEGLNMEKKGV